MTTGVSKGNPSAFRARAALGAEPCEHHELRCCGWHERARHVSWILTLNLLLSHTVSQGGCEFITPAIPAIKTIF